MTFPPPHFAPAIIPNSYTHSSDKTAICGSWKYLLFQSHIPTVEILT